MEIELSILRFIGFIGIEIGFMVAVLLVAMLFGYLIISSGKVKGLHFTFISMLAEIIGVFFFFSCLWILTGVPYTSLLGILILVSMTPLIVTELIWLAVGGANVPYPGRIIWSQYESGELWPSTFKWLKIMGAFPLLIYTIYIGIGFFGETPSQDQWTRYIFQATMVFILGNYLLLHLPKGFYTVTSQNILGPTRVRILISQTMGAIPIMLYFSLLLWATTDIGDHTAPLGSVFVVSPVLSLLITTYIVLFVILPFFIGHYRSKHQLSIMQSRRDKYLEEFQMALGSPGVEQVEQKLRELEEKTNTEIEALMGDKSIRLGQELLDTDPSDPAKLLAKIGLEDSIDRDPRFTHITAIQNIYTRVLELLESITEGATADEKRASIDVTATELQRVRDQQYVKDSSASAWAIGLVLSAGTTLLSPIWSTISNHLLKIIGIETSA